MFLLLSATGVYLRNNTIVQRERGFNGERRERPVNDARLIDTTLSESIRVGRDIFIIFVVSTVATGFGYGATFGIMVASWFGFALGILAVASTFCPVSPRSFRFAGSFSSCDNPKLNHDLTMTRLDQKPLVPTVMTLITYLFFFVVLALALRSPGARTLS